MELDDLKIAWRELDSRLGTTLELHFETKEKLHKTRSALRRLAGGQIYELVANFIVALLVGSFLGDHIETVRFAFPAAMLLAFAAFGMAVNIRQLALIGGIDYAAPVVEIQREIATLRSWRIRTTQGLLLVAPLLWPPLAIVGARALGVDLYRIAGPAWIAWNFAFGLAVIPLGLWIAHWLAGRPRGSRVLTALADTLAGRSLATARGHLEEIARFAAE